MFDGIGKLILGIFNFSILVYYRISISSVLVVGCRNLIIPKIRCYFNVNAPFIKLFLLGNSSIYAGYAGGKVE